MAGVLRSMSTRFFLCLPTVLTPVGLDKVKGVISAAFLKDPTDTACAISADWRPG